MIVSSPGKVTVVGIVTVVSSPGKVTVVGIVTVVSSPGPATVTVVETVTVTPSAAEQSVYVSVTVLIDFYIKKIATVSMEKGGMRRLATNNISARLFGKGGKSLQIWYTESGWSLGLAGAEAQP